MKNRFGNVTYDSTLSQGLYPFKWDTDTLAHSAASFNFEVQEGTILLDTLSSALPSIQSASLTQVVAYRDISFNSTTSSGLPEIISASLTVAVSYQAAEIDSDSLSASLPTIQTASVTKVVQIQELYDGALARPEDTLQHTFTLEFS